MEKKDRWTLEDCIKDPACDPVEELHLRLGFPSADKSELTDTAAEYVDRVTDLIREHNIGGARGREMADEVDRITERERREAERD